MNTANRVTTMTPSRLTRVFSVHRFIAGSFACQMIFFVESTGVPHSPTHLFITNSFGVLLSVLSIVINAARYFSLRDQRGFAHCAVILFCLELVVCSYHLWLTSFSDADTPALIVTVVAFAGLLAAYCWALMESVGQESSASVAKKSRAHIFFSIYRVPALLIAATAFLFPNETILRLKGEEASRDECLALGMWAGIAAAFAVLSHKAAGFAVQAARSIATAFLLGYWIWAALCLYRLQFQGELPKLATSLLLQYILPVLVWILVMVLMEDLEDNAPTGKTTTTAAPEPRQKLD